MNSDFYKLMMAEIYFHKNSVLGGEFKRLKVGSLVLFAEDVGERGPKASTVKVLEEHKRLQ